MNTDEILAKAHRIRHEGIELENAGRLLEAEEKYDEALRLYREHDKNDTLGYANAVRYPAVVKNLLGKRDESAALARSVREIRKARDHRRSCRSGWLARDLWDGTK